MKHQSITKNSKSEANLLKSKLTSTTSAKSIGKVAPQGGIESNPPSNINDKNKNSKTNLKSLDGKEVTIPRNVNFYRHIINRNDATENDVEFVLKLRGPPEDRDKLARVPNQPFSVSAKAIESTKEGRKVVDVGITQNKLSDMQHLIRHRLGPSPSLGQVAFEAGLRSYKGDEKFAEKERGFTTVPKKDKKEFPQLFPSIKEMETIKKWTTKNTSIQTHSAFDGYITFPKYDHYEQQEPRNVQETRHLQYPGKRVSTLAWELSMRGGLENEKPTAKDQRQRALVTKQKLKEEATIKDKPKKTRLPSP